MRRLLLLLCLLLVAPPALSAVRKVGKKRVEARTKDKDEDGKKKKRRAKKRPRRRSKVHAKKRPQEPRTRAVKRKPTRRPVRRPPTTRTRRPRQQQTSGREAWNDTEARVLEAARERERRRREARRRYPHPSPTVIILESRSRDRESEPSDAELGETEAALDAEGAPIVHPAGPPPSPVNPVVADKNHPDPRAAANLADTPANVDIDAVSEDVPAYGGWFSGAELDLSYANHLFAPLAVDREGADWAGVTTTEEYEIDALHLYRAALAFRTSLLRLEVAYESDRGFDLGGPPSSLLDLALNLAALPWLDGLTLAYRDLDFRHGEARLLSRADGTELERAPFRVTLRQGELRYTWDSGLHVLGRYMAYALPRNVYLREDVDGFPVYHQVSEHLHQVDADLWLVGAGFGTRAGPGWDAGIRLAIGVGPYDLNALDTGERLDEGLVAGTFAAGHLGYRWQLAPWFSVGLKDEIALSALQPLGLSDGLDARLRAEGLDASAFALDFGGVEVFNHATVYVVFEI